MSKPVVRTLLPFASRFLPLLAAASILLAACGGGGGGGGNNLPDSVRIKGTFTGGAHASNRWYDRLYRWMVPRAHALDPTKVARVWTINLDTSYWSDPVIEGYFTVQAPKGKPVGLAFSGAAGQFLGYLSLGGGIDSLPLVRLDNVDAVDLATLNSSGRIVEPTRNPIDNLFRFSSDELKVVAQSNLLFANFLRNLDADRNGVMDVAEGRAYYFNISPAFIGGYFDNAPVASVLFPTVLGVPTIPNTRIFFTARDSTYPDNVWITGPPGSRIENLASFGYGDSIGHRIYGFRGYPGAPPAGSYSVVYKSLTLDMEAPDAVAAASNLLLPVPTVTLNDNGTIHKVTLSYRLPDGSAAAVDPGTFIDNSRGVSLGIGMKDDSIGILCPGESRPGYNSPPGLGVWTEHVLSCQNVPWDNVYGLGFTYRDIYNNERQIAWNNRTPSPP